MDKYVDRLLQALEDERVISKINALINGAENLEQRGEGRDEACEDNATEYTDLQQRLEEAVSKADALANYISSLETEKQSLTDDLCRQKADFEIYREDKKIEINKLQEENAQLVDFEKRLENEKKSLESENAQLAAYEKQLESDKKAIESENAKLIKDLDKLKKDNVALKSRYDDALKREKLLESYVGKPLSVYLEYQKVSEDERANLRTIISDKSVITFVSSGSRQSTLDSLWDYIKNLIFTNGDPEEIRILGNVFGYFFELINESAGKALLVPDATEVGDTYDDDF
ncbi:MAG: hypothetical protein K2O54_06540, partial [Prevotella sp.]|nr:hypothetical protein [Prevotella sp.]